jgi:hypothetical protein
MIRQTALITIMAGTFVCSVGAQRGEPARQAPAKARTAEPGKAAAEKAAPGKAAEKAEPGQAAEGKAAAGKAAAGKAAPGKAAAEKAAPGQAAAKAQPGQAAERKAAAGKAPPRRGRARHRDVTVVNAFVPRAGPVGSEVTIRGRQLDADGIEVLFAGETVEPTRSTDRAITFEVPEGVEGGAIVLQQPQRPTLVVGTFEVTDKPVKRVPTARRYADHKKKAKARWAERRKELADDEDARIEALREREEALRRSREERRRQRADALAAELDGELREQPGVEVELSLHAERQARLERMLRLAEAKADGKLVVRIDVLLQREADRHEQRMKDLRSAARSR